MVIALGGIASADDASQAKHFFVSGSKHFDLGEYSEALNDFKEGYRLKDDPVFLYNIAQCQRLLNQNVEAIRTYKAFLRRKPDAPNRAEVERKIDALEAAQRSQEQASSSPPNHVIEPDGHAADAGNATTTATSPLVTQAPPPRTPVYKKWGLSTSVWVG